MKHAISLLCAASAAASLNAANIAWVSFHGTDLPSANAAGAGLGFTQAPDIGYTDLLTQAGHTVTRFTTQDNAPAALMTSLAPFDLVIISRSVNSGHYQTDAESAAWNGLAVPTIITGGYLLRGGDANSRLGYTQGSTMPDTVGDVTITVTQPDHPIFQGLTLGAGNTLSYAVPVTTPSGAATRGISVNDNPIFGTGLVLATAPVANSGMIIGEWEAGSLMNTTLPGGTADILGADRLVILTGSRENTGQHTETAGIYDLTPEGAQVFLNAVNYMAVPEPAVGSLLVLGGLGLLIRRRK